MKGLEEAVRFERRLSLAFDLAEDRVGRDATDEEIASQLGITVIELYESYTSMLFAFGLDPREPFEKEDYFEAKAIAIETVKILEGMRRMTDERKGV